MQYFTQDLGFKEDHFFINWKLLVLVLLNVIGGIGSWYSFKYQPFAASKVFVTICAVCYLILLSIWTVASEWMMWQTIFRGTNAKKSVWLITKLSNPDGIFYLQIIDPVIGKKVNVGNPRAIVSTVEFHISNWIDEDGYLVPQMKTLESIKSKLDFIKKN